MTDTLELDFSKFGEMDLTPNIERDKEAVLKWLETADEKQGMRFLDAAALKLGIHMIPADDSDERAKQLFEIEAERGRERKPKTLEDDGPRLPNGHLAKHCDASGRPRGLGYRRNTGKGPFGAVWRDHGGKTAQEHQAEFRTNMGGAIICAIICICLFLAS